MDTKKEDELREMNIFLKVPESAVALQVSAKIIDGNGNLVRVGKSLTVQDLFRARKDFLDNVPDGDDYDAKYVLTDTGRECLERLMEE